VLQRVVKVLRRRADGFVVDGVCGVFGAWSSENDRQEEVGDVCRGGVEGGDGRWWCCGWRCCSFSQPERETARPFDLKLADDARDCAPSHLFAFA
jgi:hypothetical protein